MVPKCTVEYNEKCSQQYTEKCTTGHNTECTQHIDEECRDWEVNFATTTTNVVFHVFKLRFFFAFYILTSFVWQKTKSKRIFCSKRRRY